MIFVGFGFSMVFLKTHSWTAVAYNYFIAAFCIQIDVKLFIRTLFGAATVLISFGGVLGKVNALQLLVMSIFELFFYFLNEALAINKTMVCLSFLGPRPGGLNDDPHLRRLLRTGRELHDFSEEARE